MIGANDSAVLRGHLDAICPAVIERDVTGRRFVRVPYEELQQVRQAAEAHLATLPKTKMVEVWTVEFAQVKPNTLATWEAARASFSDRAAAIEYERIVRNWPSTACIKVTGPHLQCVPA